MRAVVEIWLDWQLYIGIAAECTDGHTDGLQNLNVEIVFVRGYFAYKNQQIWAPPEQDKNHQFDMIVPPKETKGNITLENKDRVDIKAIVQTQRKAFIRLIKVL